MTYRHTARRTPRRIPTILVAGVLLVIAGLGFARLAFSSSTAASPSEVFRSDHPGELSSTPASPIDVLRNNHPGALGEADGVVPDGPMVLRGEHRGALGEADGVVPDGTTVFDDDIPGVANLDPALTSALRQAATDATDDGIEFLVNSGWRSPEYQKQLLRAAVSKYGSEEKAARWVGTPTTSAHVSGEAVDVGPFAATAWLSEHGAAYGLCQVYRNEPWHYELRPGAIDHGCPRMFADPTHDPKMQQ